MLCIWNAVLCRAEAKRLWQGLKPKLDDLGVGLACVAHEWIEPEIKAFNTEEYWGGDVYLDKEKAFFKALGGGKVRKGNLLAFLNPASRVWKNVKEAKEVGVPESNLTGDGVTMGGLMVVRQGSGGVEYAFIEETFGDHADHDEVLAAAKAAASKK
eukprot:jgi/Botrbrau1/15159/Bobra.0149s0026.2